MTTANASELTPGMTMYEPDDRYFGDVVSVERDEWAPGRANVVVGYTEYEGRFTQYIRFNPNDTVRVEAR